MRDHAFPALFRQIIVWVLLALYVGTVAYMTYAVVADPHRFDAKPADATPKPDPKDFPAGITIIVTTVGGLISAVVVATLAVTKPGHRPALLRASTESDPQKWTGLEIATLAYLVVWLTSGLVALVVGTMMYPDASKTLSGIGTAWLGLAAAAGFAYFGLTPPAAGLRAVRDGSAPAGAGSGVVRIALTVDVNGPASVERCD